MSNQTTNAVQLSAELITCTGTSPSTGGATLGIGGIKDGNGNLVTGQKAGSAAGNGTVSHGYTGIPNYVGVQPSTATAASISASGITNTQVAIALGATAAFNFLSTIA